MSFLKKLFGDMDPIVKDKNGKHCGICGFDLEDDDTMCPACGGDPISADEDWDDEEGDDV